MEDRVLYDGVPDAPVAPPDQPVDDPLAPSTAASPADDVSSSSFVEQAPATERHEIVFVDKRVGHYEQLVADLLREGDKEVYFLDRNSDGLAQIERALAGRNDIDALHILSHGEQGQLRLGSTLLTQDSMQRDYAETLQRIGSHLGDHGDILIYGCDFASGAAGQAAAETLATLTGADIAATTDDTGHASRQANWTLELQIGLIETGVAIGLSAQQNWRGILATDGDLQVELIAAPNFVVDSNQPESGPSAAYIGVKVTNTGSDTLQDVFVYAGDFAGGSVGLYPVLSDPTFGSQTYSGDLSLIHEGGTADATRYLGNLAAGETRVQYFLVSYPTTDDNGVSLAGASSDPGDDVVLPYDIWVTADDPIDGGLEAVANGQATLRSEISASANKIWPNTDSKVPNEYLDAFEQQLGWRPDANAVTPGAEVQLQGIWYDMGRVIGGYDGDGDLLPDYDVWMQPVGDADVFDTGSFRLVKTYGVLIVKLNDGTEQVIAFEDQLYHKDLPANNTGVVGLVFYEFVATGSQTQATLSPYQQAASGSVSAKYNGDYGTSGGVLASDDPQIDFNKDAVDAGTEASITSISRSATLEYVLQATNSSTTSAFGGTTYGLPVVIEDEIPEGTTYVLGSAAADNSHSDVTILYSTDDGLTWTSTEPILQPVTNIQWWLLSPLDPGEMFEATFQVTVAADFTDAILANTGSVGLGSGNVLAEDTEHTLIQGTSSISGVVFSDDGSGGGGISDATHNGTEGTLDGIDVSLFVDMDGDGVISAADILWGTTSTVGGAYTFDNLPDGAFLLQVAALDPDRPAGWTLTTDGLATLTITGVSAVASDFGFGPVLDVDKELVGTGPIYEGDLVSYTIDVHNLLGEPWGESVGGYLSYTTWAGGQHPTLTTTGNVANAGNAFGTGPDGIYAGITFSNNPTDTLGGGTFVVDSHAGNITSVELLVWGYLEGAHNNDSLIISAQTNSGALHQLGTISGAQLQASTAPTLFTFNVTDADPIAPGIQGWDWSDFTALATTTGIQIQTVKSNGPDGTTFHVDAFGFRIVTDQSVIGTGTAANTLTQVPLIDDYDQSALRFVSASIAPTTVDEINGVLTWSNIGTLLPGQTETITVTFEVLEPAGNLPLSNVSNVATSSGALLGDGSPANSDTDTVLVNLQPTAIIGDRVWLDHNNNQLQSGTEPGLSGVTVILRNSGGTEIDRTVTDAEGNYEFRVDVNGAYSVVIDTATLPGVMNSTTGGNTRSVTISSLTDNVAIDFGYQFTQPVIYGNIWHDADGDGLTGNTSPESGEGGLAGVTVVLFDVGRNKVNATVTTDAYGNYFIPVAQSGNGANATYVGNYEVRITTTGIFTSGSAVQTVDPDATRNNAHSVSITATDITNGNTLRGGFDFAYTNTGALSIGDQVFYDWDGDGQFNAGQDEGVANLTVSLYEDENGDGVIDAGVDALVAVTTTDANGNYLFTSRAAGDYIVQIDTADADYPIGTAALTGDSRAVGLTASTTAVDFAYIPVGSASITGTVWDDRNGDQIQSGTLETGLSNVTVSLYADLNGDGVYSLVRTFSTDAAGHYQFDALPAGDFRIVVDESDADLLTAGGQPRVLTTGSGTLDITLTSTTASTGNNFGFAQLGSIGDTIFFDANRNGSFDDFEVGIAGVTVRLLDADGALLGTTVTSNGTDGKPVGFYRFANLAPGEYQVEVDVSTLPATAGANTADPDRDGVPSWDHTYPTIDALYPADNRDEGIQINYGVAYQGGDIGYEQTGVVGDRVWLDQNGDGTQQSGESGLSNVRVTATNGIATIETFTNSDGQYVLTGLTAGNWNITVDTGTIVYSQTVATTSGVDNTFVVTIDGNGAVTHIDGVDVTGNTDPQLAVDFGYRLDGAFAISGTVVLEQTGAIDGLAGDTTDTPVAGATLFLFRSTGELLSTTTTASDGSYSFINLPADDGTYDYIVALVRNLPLFENTQLTTTALDTPADTILVIGNTVRQQLSLSASTTGLDFAFVSTVNYDYGDLPVNYSNTVGDSPTGPRHILTGSGPYLGAQAPDADADAHESPNADGDVGDDGVTFINVGQWADGTNGGTLEVAVNGSGWLVGWIDFDGDGSFSDANELIVNQAVSTGTYSIDFDIPTGTIDGDAQDLFARFRLFANEPLIPQLAFTGTATGGEVEDYRIAVPQQTVTIGDAQVTEGGDLVFDVALASASRAAITLDLAATGVSTTGGTDFEIGNFEYSTDGFTWLPATGSNGTVVTFAPGVTSLQVRINTTDDSDRELTETLMLSVSSHTGPAGDTSDAGTGSILDNDNAVPTTSNSAVTSVEDGSHTFQLSDFPYSDADSDPLTTIRITSLPTDGQLVYDGVTVTQSQIDAGLTIAVADIGKLQFVPDTNENGNSYATFGFSVSDGVAESAAATMTVHVTPVNDAPTLTLPGDQTATAGAPLVLSGLSIADIDAASGDVTVTLSIGAGTLNINAAVVGGLTSGDIVGNGSGSVTLTGTIAQINATLADASGLTYTYNVSGTQSLSVVVNDEGNAGVDPSTVGQPATGDADDERATGSFTITIPAPTLAVNSVTVTEGTDSHAVFAVSLSNPTTTDVSVSLALAGVTATGGSVDFGAAGTTNLQVFVGGNWVDATSATITAGTTSILVRTPVSDDVLSDNGETFTLTATVTTGTTVNPFASGTGTINDETPGDVVYASLAGPVTVNEGSTTASYTLTLTTTAVSDVTVTLSYSAGTAVAGTDYTVQTIVTIPAGSTSATFTLPTTQDTISEGDEPFTVSISGVSGGGFEQIAIDTANDSVTTTIVDDDVANLSIADVTVTEGTDPYAVFTLSLSAASTGPVTVALSLADGSASVGNDTGTSAQLEYFDGSNWVTVPANGQVTILAGDTSLQVRTAIADDMLDEANETFTLTAAYVSGSLGSTSNVVATGTILDNDPLPSLSINDVTRNEADGTITFTVSLNTASGRTVTVNYATASGTAGSPGDFASDAGALTFNPGETTKSITINLTNDNVTEATETFTVGLAGATNATISDATGIGTILDNDAAQLSINDVSQSEGDSGSTTYTFTVSLDQAVDTAVSVNWTTANGTTDGSDLAAQSGSVTFAAGEFTKTFSVTVSGDQTVELNETFLVNLSGLSADGRDVTIADNQGQGTIVNDDAAQLSINDVSQTEGDSGTTTYTFTVSLDQPVDTAVSVNWATANGSTNGTDLSAQSGTITLAAGETSKTFNVTINGDQSVELDETFLVNLAGLSAGGRNVTIADSQGQGTILNDDAAQLSINDVSQSEGDSGTTTYTFTVSLDQAVDAPVSVNWSTANGSTDGTDLTAQSGSITFAAGETSKTFSVSVSGDQSVELNETFLVNLSGLSAGGRNVTIADSQGQGTILNDDAAQVSINDVSQTEGDSGTTTYTFTVSLDQPVDTAVSVNWITANGTTDGSDLAGQSGTVTFAAGETTKTVTVSVSSDRLVEPDETFVVNLSGLSANGRNVSISDSQGQGTILNDDHAPTTANQTVSTDEDVNYTFQATDFPFADADGDAFVSLTLTSLPTDGTLLYAGTPVTQTMIDTGLTIPVANIGQLVFQPDANEFGSPYASFGFLVSDGVNASTSATMNINVVSDNDPPTARDNEYTTNEDASVSGNLLDDDTGTGVDSDSDGGTLTVVDGDANGANGLSPVTGPANGTVVLNSNGTFTYTPNGNFFGDDSFTYRISDGQGGFDVATVTIHVTAINDDPTATDNSADVTEDGPLTDSGNALTDNDGSGLDSDPENNPLHISTITIGTSTVSLPGSGSSITINGQYGTLTIARDGSYSYTLNNSLAAVQGLDGGESINDTFTYELSDGQGGTDTADLIITIHGVNDPPTVDSGSITVQEGSNDNPLGLSAPTDVDSEPLTIVVTGLPTLGTITLADGTLVTNGMTLTTAQVTGLLYDAPSVYDGSPAGSFTYTVFDGDSTVPGSVSIAVTRPVANTDGNSVTAGDVLPASGNVLDNDSDPESDPLVVTQVTFGATTLAVPSDGSDVVINGTYGVLTIHDDGSYEYDLNDTHPDVIALNAAGTLSETFNYSLADGNGGSDSASLVITIHGQNDVPAATDNTAAVTEDGPTTDSGNLLFDNDGDGADTDPDADPLAVSRIVFGTMSVVVPVAGSVTIDGAYGTLTIAADGSYSYALNNSLAAVQQLGSGDSLREVFHYTATDGTKSDTADLTITIAGVNDDPTPVGAIPNQSNVDGQAIPTLNVSGTFEDVDLSDSLTYDDGGTLPPGLSIDSTTGLITGTLTADASQGGTGGVYTVTITVTDESGRTASQTFQWTVTNPAPTATDNAGLVREDGPLADSGNLLTDNDGFGRDSDPDGDALAVTAIGSSVVPAVGSVLVTGTYGTLRISANGEYTYSLNNTHPAVQALGAGESLAEVFTYTVSDGEGGSDTANLVIAIQGANDPPAAVDDTNATDSDTPVTGRVLPNDSDPDASDTLSVVAINGSAASVGHTIVLPSGALLRLNGDGTYSYDPNGAFDHLNLTQTAIDSFTYTISDGHGGTDTAKVVITIAGLNDPPTAWGELMHTPMDQAITAHVLDNDSDPNGDPLSVIVLEGPDEGTVVVNSDGTITFTPAPGFHGMVAIRYLAEDPHGASSNAMLLIMVDPPAPVNPPVPAFGFDSFNNFSKPRQILGDDGLGTERQPLLSRQIFTLAPEPTFSGYARPGTTVVGRIYDERGVLIGEGFAHSDPGGNWMMQFQGIAKFEHYRIEFDYIVESQDIYGYLGLDPSDNSYQAMQPLTDWMEPLSVAGAFRQSPWESLNSLHHSLQQPLGLGSK